MIFRIPCLKQALVALVLTVGVWSVPANCDELVIIGEHRRPWIYYENDVAQGMLYDVMAEIVEELGHTPGLYLTPFKRSYAVLLNGFAHFSVMPLPAEPEKRNAVLSNFPSDLVMGEEILFQMPIVAIALKSKGYKPFSAEEVLQLRIGQDRLLPYLTQMTPGGKKYSEYKNAEMQLKALMHNRIDVAITAGPIFLQDVKRLGLEDKLEIIYTLDHHNTYLIWSAKALGHKHQSLPAEAEKVLISMKEKGRIAEIIEHYSDISLFSNY